MQRMVYRAKAGSLANMKLQRDELPGPAPEEVTVEVKAIGLNFADIFAIWGLYSATPKGVFTPGLEYSGVVLDTGRAVRGIKKGDRVMGVTRFGGYTTHLNIDRRYVLPLPSDWSYSEGAAYLVQVLTAYYALVRLGNLQEGQCVLIHSGAGGVGLLANRIAKKYHAYTIGTVGNEEKVDFLKGEGYDAVIVRGRHFRRDLARCLGDRKLLLVLECIGGSVLKAGYEQLAPSGRMVVYGSARYASRGNRPNYLKLLYYHLLRPRIDPQKMIEENKAILGFNLIWLYHEADLMHQILEAVNRLELDKPYVGHTFSFTDLPSALRLFQSGHTIGKVVVLTA